jgi:hypothetical protein
MAPVQTSETPSHDLIGLLFGLQHASRYSQKRSLFTEFCLTGYNAMYTAGIQRGVSMEHTASTFNVNEEPKQETNTKRATSTNIWM